MNYYNKTIALLEEALGSSLTDSQKLIVYLNSKVITEEFDIANFAVINRINPSMAIPKLGAFGKLIEEFWEKLSPEDINEFQNNPEALVKALRKFEINYTDSINVDFLNKYGFNQNDLFESIPYAMLKAIKENKKEVCTNIEYLIKIGIKNYNEIFNAYYELFLMDPSSFEGIFNKYDQEDLISKLEKNIEILEYL